MKPLLLVWVCLSLCGAAAAASPKQTQIYHSPFWVTGYYAAWHQQDGSCPPSKIDYAACTHLVHFSIIPRADGTIDESGISDAQSAAVIGPAHAAGCKVLLCVGGAETAALFRPALRDSVRPRLIANLVGLAVERGYDGIDIDMEPITDADVPLYAALIRELRARIDTVRPGLLLTAATSSQPTLFAGLQRQFDQINLMTYDLSGPWQGFKTWYNASLCDGGHVLMTDTVPYPSVQGTVRKFTEAGIAPGKLGLGLAFYGDVWIGADGPQQSIEGVTVTQISYAALMDRYFQPERYHWDEQARSPYLSISAADPKQRKFISYDDARLCGEKVRYAGQHGLGGVIIWEIGDGYQQGQPPGRQNPLLQAVKQAWKSGFPAAAPTTPPKAAGKRPETAHSPQKRKQH